MTSTYEHQSLFKRTLKMSILKPILKKLVLLPVIFAMSTVAYAKKETLEDSWFVKFQNQSPTFYVKSDGQKYIGLSQEQHSMMSWQIPAQFTYDAPDNDRIKSYALQLRLKWELAGKSEKFLGSRVTKSYGVGERPKKIDKEVRFPVNGAEIESFAVNACNTTADGFRNIGQSNALIFSRIHHVYPKIYASHAIDIQAVPPGSFDSGGPYLEDTYAKIVCMKAPAPTVDTADSLQTNSGVTDASLTILEQTTLGGACKVNLSTVFKTNLPNTEVRYQFEHTNGNKSDIKTVTTSHSKTAMDAHWYDVPLNPNGAEAGSVRIVGVSHDFQSSWKSYNMDCKKPSPNILSLVTKPTVQLDLLPINNVMHQGMICPTKVKITATLSSQNAFSGTGVVSVKTGQFSFATHDVNLNPNVPWRYDETLDLKPWNTINAPVGQAGGTNTWQTQPGSGTPTPSQRFEVRYSLNANQQNVIQTPYKTISVSCTAPKVNQQLLPSKDLKLKAPDAPQSVQPRQLQLKQIEQKQQLIKDTPNNVYIKSYSTSDDKD